MQSCAVIGCGAAGMAAAASLRQAGMLVTCFELASEAGGLWSSGAHTTFSRRGLLSPIYPAMRSRIPKDMLCFSDVRFDYTVAQFPHHSAVRAYLARYAARKGIAAMTRFNTKVESVRWHSGQSVWKLLSVNVHSGDVMMWNFDAVCVCVGHTHEPRYPAGLRERLGLSPRADSAHAPLAALPLSRSNGIRDLNNHNDACQTDVEHDSHGCLPHVCDDSTACIHHHNTTTTHTSQSDHQTLGTTYTQTQANDSNSGSNIDNNTVENNNNNNDNNSNDARAHVQTWRWSGEFHHACHVKDIRRWRHRRVLVVGDATPFRPIMHTFIPQRLSGDATGAWDFCTALHRIGAEVIYSMDNTDYAIAHKEWRVLEHRTDAQARLCHEDETGLCAFMPNRFVGEVYAGLAHDKSPKRCNELPSTRSGISCVGPICRPNPPRYGGGNMSENETTTTTSAMTTADVVVMSADGLGERIVENVEAIICATGYRARYPFLHPDTRALWEDEADVCARDDTHSVRHTTVENTKPTSCLSCTTTPHSPKKHTKWHATRGLYLGTLDCHMPTLAAVGRQPHLWPPLMLFEAQSRFIAFAWTRRISIPSSCPARWARQQAMMTNTGIKTGSRRSLHGALCDCFPASMTTMTTAQEERRVWRSEMDVVTNAQNSAAYFDVLQSELGVSSRESYRSCLWRRRRWLAWSVVLRVIHKLRSMAPLQRKRQHILFDNKI